MYEFLIGASLGMIIGVACDELGIDTRKVIEKLIDRL